NHDRDAAVAEVERVARRGNVRGLEVARRHDMTPLWDPWWNPVWDAIAASGLPVHFHTIGGPGRDFSKLTGKTLLAARAASISSFQMHMADVLMSMIFAGVLHHRPQMKMVIGEAGTGWIPYILDRMDAEWEDQRVLAAPVLRHLPERPDRGEADRGTGRGQHHVGVGLPAPRRHLPRLAGIHREGARSPAGGDQAQDRLRQRRQALPLRQLSRARLDPLSPLAGRGPG